MEAKIEKHIMVLYDVLQILWPFFTHSLIFLMSRKKNKNCINTVDAVNKKEIIKHTNKH